MKNLNNNLKSMTVFKKILKYKEKRKKSIKKNESKYLLLSKAQKPKMIENLSD